MCGHRLLAGAISLLEDLHLIINLTTQSTMTCGMLKIKLI